MSTLRLWARRADHTELLRQARHAHEAGDAVWRVTGFPGVPNGIILPFAATTVMFFFKKVDTLNIFDSGAAVASRALDFHFFYWDCFARPLERHTARSEQRRKRPDDDRVHSRNHHDAAGAEASELLRHAAKGQGSEAPPSAPPDNQQINLLAFHDVDDRFRRIAAFASPAATSTARLAPSDPSVTTVMRCT